MKNTDTMKSSQRSQKIAEMVVFAMLGTLMFATKLIMELLPNIHLLGTLTMVYTIAFRTKALIPIYIYVFLNGLIAAFSLWWVPYLYIWTILWAITMLLPRNISKKVACFVYPAVCLFHGLAFGILYAPAQALLFGMDFKQTVAWIMTGAPFDILHGIGNLATGVLVLPLSEILKKLAKKHLGYR